MRDIYLVDKQTILEFQKIIKNAEALAFQMFMAELIKRIAKSLVGVIHDEKTT